jgi:hypothetical protein
VSCKRGARGEGSDPERALAAQRGIDGSGPSRIRRSPGLTLLYPGTTYRRGIQYALRMTVCIARRRVSVVP